MQLNTHLRCTFVVACLLSCPTLCDPMDCSMPGSSVPHYLLEFAQAPVHWVSDAIQPPHPLLPSSPPALNLPQHQGLFQWVGSSHQVAKVLGPQLQHQSFQWIFNEYSSFRMHWFDLLSVQGTLKSFLQHHSLKASVLQHSVFMVQFSHLYMTTEKTRALTIWTSVWKVMPLLFHVLSRFVIAFLPRSKHLWISWLRSPSTVYCEQPQTYTIVVWKLYKS